MGALSVPMISLAFRCPCSQRVIFSTKRLSGRTAIIWHRGHRGEIEIRSRGGDDLRGNIVAILLGKLAAWVHQLL